MTIGIQYTDSGRIVNLYVLQVAIAEVFERVFPSHD
jgi:hypothetical protein